MTTPPKRRVTDHFGHDLLRIITTGDLTLAGVLMGFAMILWGLIGVFVSPPVDMQWFVRDFVLSSVPFWFCNHVGAGAAFIWCSVRKFPHPQSLFLGAYCTMMWTFIAVSRPVASFTSGMTLNLVVILMGVLLIHRSGKK